MPRIVRVARNIGPWFASCALGCALALLLHHYGHRLLGGGRGSALPSGSSAVRALGCYRQRSIELADAVTAFSATTPTDHATFRAAASPLAEAIRAANEAYVELARARFTAFDDAARTRSRGPEHARLFCTLTEVERFHWRDQRTQLNSLLLHVLRAWRHPPSSATLATIRAHQKDAWPAYAALLRAFASDRLALVESERCAARAQ